MTTPATPIRARRQECTGTDCGAVFHGTRQEAEADGWTFTETRCPHRKYGRPVVWAYCPVCTL